MSKKERISEDAEAPDSQRERVVAVLSEESAEHEEIERLEFFKQLRRECDLNDAGVLNATERHLDECEAEDALRSGTLFSDPNDDLVN